MRFPQKKKTFQGSIGDKIAAAKRNFQRKSGPRGGRAASCRHVAVLRKTGKPTERFLSAT